MSSGRFITKDGCSLAYEVIGEGAPVLWQHGLGGDRRQAAEVFPQMQGVQRITLECRGHGESDLGEPDGLSIAQFAEDAVRLLDHLDIGRVTVGGISLGAAISLRLAVTMPRRISSLILGRPAWVDRAAPASMRPYLLVADLLRRFGAEEGLRLFEQSKILVEVESVSPDNAASLRGCFSRNGVANTIELLSRIAADGPGVASDEIAEITVPTVVIANREEYVHPIEYAERLRGLIPGSSLQIVTSKTVNKGLYVSEFRAAIASFLETHESAR